MTKANDDEVVWVHLKTALAGLKKSKPNDRSDKDRAYAVTITEMEKLVAYFFTYVYSRSVIEGDDE